MNKLNNFKNIFLNQLKLYLRKPLFYIIAVVFTVAVYFNYFIKLQFFAGSGTSDLLLYFSFIPYLCILIIPALCYKTNITLYDDFIPAGKLTKNLAKASYIFTCYIILLVLLIPGIVLVNLCGDVDVGQVFASYLCLLFYGAAVISLCLFIQNNINSQVISFVVSAVILAIVNNAHSLPVFLNLNGFASGICKSLSFAWRFDAASKGIVDTRDLSFLLGVTFFFFILDNLIKEKNRGKILSSNDRNHFILSFAIIILLILNGNNWYKRIDCSQSKIFTLSKYSKSIAKKLDKNLKITYYRSSSLKKLYPQIRDVSDFLMMFSSGNKNITFQIKDPDKENLTELLNDYGIYSQQMRSIKNNSTEFSSVYSAIVMEYNGNVEIIPFIMAADTLEYDLDYRLLYLMSQKERIVNIIVGNGLSLAEDYNYVIPYLSSQGFLCKQLFTQDPVFNEILDNSSGPLLIIGDEEIGIENAIAIEDYILKNKGNAFICVSPFTAKITDDWSLHFAKKTNIVEMVENWGVSFADSITADISCARITMYSQEENSFTKILNYPLWVSAIPQINCNTGVTTFWPATLFVDNEIAKSYVVTTPAAYSFDIDRHNKESLIQTNPFILEENPEVPLNRQTKTLIAYISGKLPGLYNDFISEKDSEIIVIPDQYFLNSLMNEYIGGDYGDYRNFDYLVYNLLILNGEKELAALQSRNIRDKSLYKLQNFINQLK